MKSSSFKLVFALILVFASGAAVGALGYRSYEQAREKQDRRPKSPEEYRQAYLAEMKSRLKLSDGQSKRLEAIMDDTRQKFRELREKQAPDFKAIQDAQTAAINNMLSTEQQAEYAKMRRERDERRKAAKERGR